MMLVRVKYKLNVRKILENNLKTHPVLKKRFENAIEVQKPKGNGFHLGVKKRKIIGDRFILLGDAGGFNDAICANGIGHAMISASYAVEAVANAYGNGGYTEKKLKIYQKKVYDSFSGIRWQGILSEPIFLYPTLLHTFMNKLFEYDGIEALIGMAIYEKNPWKLMLSLDFYKQIIKLKKKRKQNA